MNAWPHTPTGIGGSVVSHTSNGSLDCFMASSGQAPVSNPAMEGVVSMYQIVTIALEYRDLHSAQCPLAALRGKRRHSTLRLTLSNCYRTSRPDGFCTPS